LRVTDKFYAYLAGLAVGTSFIIANYLLLGDWLLIHVAPAPLMTVTLLGIPFRYFLLSFSTLLAGLIIGGTLGFFLIGVALTLFIFDIGIPYGMIDLIRTGAWEPATQIYLLFSLLFLTIIAALVAQVD